MTDIKTPKRDTNVDETIKEELRQPIVFGVRGGDRPTFGSETELKLSTPTVHDLPFHTDRPSWEVDAFDKNHPTGETLPKPTPQPEPRQETTKKTRCPKCERGDVVVEVKEKMDESVTKEQSEQSERETEQEPKVEESQQPQGYLCQLLEPMNWPTWVRSILCMNP